MEEDRPQKPKRIELYRLVFLRRIGKRDERKILAKQMTHEDAKELRDAYAKIGAEEVNQLREKLNEAELAADNVLIQKINAQIANTIAKTERSTFVIDLDRESNESFLKPVRPEFPTPSKPAGAEAVGTSEAPTGKKAKKPESAGAEAVGE